MRNELNQQVIINIHPTSASMRKSLVNASNLDKVLHIIEHFTHLCITLSRGRYGRHFQGQRTTRNSLYKAAMLDDRTTGYRTQLFHSVGSSISYGNGILQQFHAQREVVYTPIGSQFQSGRTLVPS